MTADPPNSSLKPQASSLPYLALLALTFTRATVLHEPFPYWELDPTQTIATLTGIGPAQSLILDTLTLVLAAAALFGQALGGRRVSVVAPLLLALGAIPVLYHAGLAEPISIDNVRIGSVWLTALAVGVTATHLCRDEALRRITVALAIGFVMMLAA